MKCRSRFNGQTCFGTMRPGIALMNTAFVHGDFPGDYEGPLEDLTPTQERLRGQTISNTGPAVVVSVMKCSLCGHSVTGRFTYIMKGE